MGVETFETVGIGGIGGGDGGGGGAFRELETAPGADLVDAVLEGVFLDVGRCVHVDYYIYFSLWMEEYVSRAVVVHAAIDEMDARGTGLARLEGCGVERVVVLKFFGPLLSPEVSDFGCEVVDGVSDETGRELALDCCDVGG